MPNRALVSESASVETQLASLVHEISKKSDNFDKDFSFYWSKKSPIVAASVYKIFSSNSDVILDPFVGSGSALYGLKLFPNEIKFIGVDVNQLPIEFIHFNMSDLKLSQIEEIVTKLQQFIDDNREIYLYELNKGEDPFIFKKVHLNREQKNIEPTLFVFSRNNIKITLTPKDGDKFKFARNEYLKRSNNATVLNQSLPDLVLGTNSRIAIKQGMKLSEIFSPITFNLLTKYKDLATLDSKFALVLSSCLHLCRLTDTRSQSQFPFWVPKKGALDRNIFDLLEGKVELLLKLTKQKHNKLEFELPPKKVDSFPDLSSASGPAYLLHHTPIQNIMDSQIPDDSIDLVFTDPPYFDQVAYSEYLVIWEFFTGIKSDLENEIVQSNREKFASDRRGYLKLMSEGFSVIGRKLKENHLAIIYFKDSKLNNILEFLQIMENSNLEYLHQIHVAKPKYTYKQNTSQQSTVDGDSLYVFRKVKNLPKMNPITLSENELNLHIIALIDEYLAIHGPSTASKILDNYLIPRLWKSKMLHLVTSKNVYQSLVKENYIIDKETRKVIGRI